MKTINQRLKALEYDVIKIKGDIQDILILSRKLQTSIKPQRLTKIERQLKSRQFVEKAILDLIENNRRSLKANEILFEIQDKYNISTGNFWNALRSLKDQKEIDVDKLTGYYYIVKVKSTTRTL